MRLFSSLTAKRQLDQLKSDSVIARRKAAEAIAQSSVSFKLAELQPGLHDADEIVRVRCVEALARAQEPRRFAVLSEAFCDPSPAVQQAARRAVKRQWSPEMAACVAELLRGPALSVRARAAGLLAEVGWQPSTREDEARLRLGQGLVFELVRLGEQALSALEDELESPRSTPCAQLQDVFSAISTSSSGGCRSRNSP